MIIIALSETRQTGSCAFPFGTLRASLPLACGPRRLRRCTGSRRSLTPHGRRPTEQTARSGAPPSGSGLSHVTSRHRRSQRKTSPEGDRRCAGHTAHRLAVPRRGARRTVSSARRAVRFPICPQHACLAPGAGELPQTRAGSGRALGKPESTDRKANLAKAKPKGTFRVAVH